MRYKLFKDRNFLLLMQGNMVSQIGSMMQTFALSLYVLATYESTTLFASILIVSAIPRLILGPFAGVLVDWFDRKKIIVRLDVLSGIAVTLLGFLYLQLGELPLWSIYSITIVLSLITTMFGPAVNTVIPNIIREKDLLEANSIHNMIMTLSSLLAPILAGVLMSFSVIGVILFVNGISFFISAISEYFIDIAPTHKTPEKINIQVFKKDFVDGLKVIKNSRFILTITFIALALNFAISPVFSVGVPHILKKVMFIKDYEFGMVNSVMGFAALLGGLLTAKFGGKLSLKKLLKIDMIAQPITVGILTFISSFYFLKLFNSYYLPLLLFVITGFAFVIILTAGNITINTAIQQIVPREMLGRVGTVIGTLCGAAVPLGQALFGLMVDKCAHVLPMSICVVILALVSLFSILAIDNENMEEIKVESSQVN
ncbi:MAG: MFS transporter [Clostridiales bacterium]|nr:MFS transporter [Clostridiales bacterium]